MIQWNADLARRLSCTEPEKTQITPLIKKLMQLGRTSRAEGIVRLEEAVSDINDPLFSVGIKLVSEGMSGEALEDILATYLAVSADIGVSFLKACILAEGIICLANGDDSAAMSRKLTAYYGAQQALPVLEDLENEYSVDREP